jgi:hypothetical protein
MPTVMRTRTLVTALALAGAFTACRSETPANAPEGGAPAAPPAISSTNGKQDTILSPQKESEVLKLLGRSRTQTGSGCDDVAALSDVMETAHDLLNTKGITALSQIVREGAAKCPRFEFTMMVTETPDVARIEQILGRPQLTAPAELHDMGDVLDVTWHKYGWLEFAVSEGKVVAVRADSSQPRG